MSSFSTDLNGHYLPSVKVKKIIKSATMFMSYFAAVMALHWIKVKRSTVYKVKYGVTKLSIGVQVDPENCSEKPLKQQPKITVLAKWN